MPNKLKQFLIEKIPHGKYSDGTESKCILYNICNLFDPTDD